MVHPKVAIVARTPPKIYSGGRYLSWTMAEALAVQGFDISYITDHQPPCASDFETSPAHRAINLSITRDFERDLPQHPFDVILFIPGMDRLPDLYDKTYRRALRDRARLIFHNFETPNWFNELSPQPRDPSLWDFWQQYGSRADLILSMTAEAERYARDFYTISDDGPHFRTVHPGINSRMADVVGATSTEKRIVVFARFVQAEHKGSDHIHDLIGPEMAGYTLVLVIGNGTIPDEQRDQLEQAAARHGATIEISHAVSDRDKFSELKRATLMVFPSLFEGFGLPPVEAQYCDLPCIAFDLPVLREVSGDGLIYCNRGDWAAMKDTVAAFLRGEVAAPTHLRERIQPTADLTNYAQRLAEVIDETLALPAREPRPLPRPAHGQLGRFGRWVRRRLLRPGAATPSNA